MPEWTRCEHEDNDDRYAMMIYIMNYIGCFSTGRTKDIYVQIPGRKMKTNRYIVVTNPAVVQKVTKGIAPLTLVSDGTTYEVTAWVVTDDEILFELTTVS